MELAYQPDNAQAQADAEFMAGLTFPDLDSIEQGQYLAANPLAKAAVKDSIVKSLIEGARKAGKTLAETPVTKGAIKRPQVELFEEMIPEPKGEPPVIKSPESKEPMPEPTETVAEKLSDSAFIHYDPKTDKPSYMPRFDDDATARLEYIKDDNDVDAVIQQTAKYYSGKIDESRRGVIGDKEAKELAYNLGMDKERVVELLTREDGSTASVEEVIAMRSLLDQSANRLLDLAKKTASDAATIEDKTLFEKAFLFHKDLLSKFMGYRAEAGRALRAYGVNLGGFVSPKEQQELLDQAMAGYDIKKISNLMLAAGDTRGVTLAMDGLSNLRKGIDVATTHFVYSILSGTQTQFVNFVGNSAQLGQSIADRYLSEAGTYFRVLSGIGADGESDLVAIGESAVYRQAMSYSMRQALDFAWKAAKTGEQYRGVGKFDTNIDVFNPEYWGMNPESMYSQMLKYYGNATGFMVRNVMGGTDAFFKVAAENAEFMAQAYRKAWNDVRRLGITENVGGEVAARFNDYVKHPTYDMKVAAQKHAEEITYQDRNSFASGWHRFMNEVPMLRFFTPFVNTPTSIVKQHLVDRSPLSLVVNRNTFYSNTAEGQLARTKFVSGTMMAGAFYMLYDNGFLTGSRPKDPKEAAYWEAEGIQPNSLVIPRSDGTKTYVSLQRIENVSYIASMVADMSRMLERKEVDWELNDTEEGQKIVDSASLILTAVMASMEDKTFLQGVNTLMGLTGKGSDKATVNNLQRVISDIAVSTVPLSSMRKDIAWYANPGKPKKDARTLYEKFEKTMMWLEDNLPNRLDIWGEPIPEYQKVNPVKILDGKNDPATKELVRLAKEANAMAVKILPRNYLGWDMTAREYHDMVKFIRGTKHGGVDFKHAVKAFISSDSYKALKDTPRLQAEQLKKFASDWDKNLKAAYIGYLEENDPEQYDKFIRATTIKYRKKGL